jgi:hypothetical protein
MGHAELFRSLFFTIGCKDSQKLEVSHVRKFKVSVAHVPESFKSITSSEKFEYSQYKKL